MKKLSDYVLLAQKSKSDQQLYLSQFIDDFRRTLNLKIIENPVAEHNSISQLFIATAHELCIENNLKIPNWMKVIYCLPEPYFVTDLPSVRFLSLRDSPYAFKIRNIFVPYNFLNRV